MVRGVCRRSSTDLGQLSAGQRQYDEWRVEGDLSVPLAPNPPLTI